MKGRINPFDVRNGSGAVAHNVWTGGNNVRKSSPATSPTNVSFRSTPNLPHFPLTALIINAYVCPLADTADDKRGNRVRLQADYFTWSDRRLQFARAASISVSEL